MRTLYDTLAVTAKTLPERSALCSQGANLTYAQLKESVDALTQWLLRETSEFDRIAIYLDKRPEVVSVIYACTAAKRIFVPINPALKPHQVKHILSDSGARVIVTTSFRNQQLKEALSEPPEKLILCDKAQTAGVFHWDSILSANSTSAMTSEVMQRPNVVDSDPAAILYTSGSTGAPKGVTLSHRNLVSGAESVSEYLGLTSDDCILSVLPLSFDAGLSQVTTAVFVGATLVLTQFIRPQEVVALCESHRVTAITAVPPLWVQLTEADWSSGAAASVRVIANTGGHMGRTLLAQLRSVFTNARPFLMYGLTEAFRSTYLDPAELDKRPNSIGKAVPNAEILVLNAQGKPCAPYEQGELVHRGSFVTLGYWNCPELTDHRFRPLPSSVTGVPLTERAVWSGDIVYKDEEGFIYYVSRADEQIKSSGYRVSPTEVEEVLLGSGLLHETAVFGAPHEKLGYGIVAAVVADRDSLDEKALLDHCRKKLPAYMLPTKLLVLPALPRNPNGKIDRKLLSTQHESVFQTL